MKKLSDIGMIGLAVMGENLALNMESKGFRVSVYNRTVPGIEEGIVERFISGRGKGKNFAGFSDLESFVQSLQRPRKIMMMIKAGEPVDQQIELLIPLLDKGDIIIDGGNSNYEDTNRRTEYLERKGLLFIGTGISGGEKGALEGPSIMPGGSEQAWPHVRSVLQKIAAQVEGIPCCNWVGKNGAGHFVKMVHNGIEYGDMEIIAEAYWIMKELLGMDCEEMHQIFSSWNHAELSSYLIEITADICTFKDSDGAPLVEHILDAAGQKGTGKWTAINALNFGIPLTLIAESVFARSLSARKEERVLASKKLFINKKTFNRDRDELLGSLEKAVYASKLVSYAQGFSLMREANTVFNWNLNYGNIAQMWRGGCIIRSVFLNKIKEAYDGQPDLPNLLIDDFFSAKLLEAQEAWRKVVAIAVEHGVYIPAMASALNYFDGFRSARLPANLIQAQRDYFGAHMYERTDSPRGEFFHTNWTGTGGKTASTHYQV